MNDEAESSAAGARHHPARIRSDRHALVDDDEDEDLEQPHGHLVEDEGGDGEDQIEDVNVNPEEEARERKQRAKERRLDAKRKRVIFLDHLLRELDIVVFLEFITLYYSDCSFFWFFVRSIIHLTLLTPLPDLQLARQHDEHKPVLALILFTFAISLSLHLTFAAPSAGEDTRGYLHGGLMIDFIGQQGPTSKWKLAGLDIGILVLQSIMVSVDLKKRDLKKQIAKLSGAPPAPTVTELARSIAEGPGSSQTPNADRDQDIDSEEQGILRRTDTLSDAGGEPDEEDALLAPQIDSSHADALDLLSSGQAVVGDFFLVNSLLQAHADYNTYRQTRSEASSNNNLSPATLRQLHNLRMRFGVGGG